MSFPALARLPSSTRPLGISGRAFQIPTNAPTKKQATSDRNPAICHTFKGSAFLTAAPPVLQQNAAASTSNRPRLTGLMQQTYCQPNHSAIRTYHVMGEL